MKKAVQLTTTSGESINILATDVFTVEPYGTDYRVVFQDAQKDIRSYVVSDLIADILSKFECLYQVDTFYLSIHHTDFVAGKGSGAIIGYRNTKNFTTTDSKDTLISRINALLINAKANSVDAALTGTPTAPTAVANTNTTQIATTAFVQQEILGDAGTASPIMDGVASVGVATKWSREDHVHPTDTSRAALASPTFTGTPSAPTAAANTNTTQLATTAFVQQEILGDAGTATPLMNGTATVGVATKWSREDHIHPTDTSRAALASPTFTGTPSAPTASTGTNTTQLATTAFVQSTVDAKIISATGVLDFPSIAAQTDSDLTITLTGAALGDAVVLGVPNGSTLAGVSFSAWVSTANTVTVRASNYSAAAKDPASGTFKVTVIK